MNNMTIYDKNLLVEIRRINELISPQHSPKQFLLLEGLGNIADEIIDRYKNDVSKLFGFTDSKNYATIINSLKARFGKSGGLKNLTPDTPLDIIKNAFPTLSPDVKTAFVELMIKYSNENFDDVLEDAILHIRTISKQDLELLATSFDEKEFMERLAPGDRVPEFLKTFLSRFWKNKNGMSNILSTDDINTFAIWVNRKGGKTFFSDIIKGWSTNMTEVLDNVKNLNDEFVGKMESGAYGTDEITNIINAYSLAISREMNKMNMKMKEGAKDVLKRSDLDSRLKNKILEGKEDIFVLFRELQAGSGPILIEVQKKLKGMWDSFSIGLSEKTEKIKFRYPQIKVTPEFTQYFFTGQWAFFSDFYKIAVKKNSFRSNTQKVAYFLRLGGKSIWGNILAAGILTTLWTAWTELHFKENINKGFEMFSLPAPYPNPQEGRSEIDSVIGAWVDSWIRKFFSMTDTGRFLLPFVGTIEISPVGLIGKFLMDKSKFGIVEVKKEIDDDLEEQSGDVPLPGEGELPPLPPEDNNTPTNNGKI